MRAGAKNSRVGTTSRIQLSASVLLGLGLTSAGSMMGACDSKRLCDGGACERPVGAASADGGGGAPSDISQPPVDGAIHASRDASIDIDAEPVPPALPCQEDGGCVGGAVCHPEANLCVECIDNEQCQAPTPFCAVRENPAANACVGCLGNGDCDEGICVDRLCVACSVLSNAGCDGESRCVDAPGTAPRCVECVANEDCTEPASPVCEPGVGRCVACTMDGAGCEEGQRCVAETEQAASGVDASATTRRCIECSPATASSDCRADAPYCVKDQCATCDPELGQGCDGTKPYCRVGAEVAEETGSSGAEVAAACFQCRNDEDCLLDGSFCVGGVCVECSRDTDCLDPEASTCDPVRHECVPCATSAQCKHVEGAQVCHVESTVDAGPGVGRCVECDALDYRACDGAKDVCVTVPVASQFTCSDHRVNQVGFCGECLADADCSAEERCVNSGSEANGQAGYYCIYLVGANGAPASCSEASAEPFTRALHATSVDGVTGTYCALDTTTCDVFNHFKQSCSEDADCGQPEDGATCYPADAPGRCTYTCTADADCPKPDVDCVNGRCQL